MKKVALFLYKNFPISLGILAAVVFFTALAVLAPGHGNVTSVLGALIGCSIIEALRYFGRKVIEI
jgi:hypothetical protein